MLRLALVAAFGVGLARGSSPHSANINYEKSIQYANGYINSEEKNDGNDNARPVHVAPATMREPRVRRYSAESAPTYDTHKGTRAELIETIRERDVLWYTQSTRWTVEETKEYFRRQAQRGMKFNHATPGLHLTPTYATLRQDGKCMGQVAYCNEIREDHVGGEWRNTRSVNGFPERYVLQSQLGSNGFWYFERKWVEASNLQVTKNAKSSPAWAGIFRKSTRKQRKTPTPVKKVVIKRNAKIQVKSLNGTIPFVYSNNQELIGAWVQFRADGTFAVLSGGYSHLPGQPIKWEVQSPFHPCNRAEFPKSQFGESLGWFPRSELRLV